MTSRPSIQLALLMGEGFLLLLSGGAMFVVISRCAGPDLLGEYSLVFAWMMLAGGLASFGIPEFIMRELGRLEAAGGRHAVHGMAIGSAFSVAATVLMAAVVPLFGYAAPLRSALWIASLALLPMMIAGICRAGFLARRQMHLLFAVAACETAIVVTINTALVLGGHGIVALTTTLLAGKLVASTLALFLLNRHAVPLRFEFDRAFARELLGPIVIFGLSNALGMVALRINTIMLSVWGTMAAVGQYAVATKLVEITLIVPSLFNQLMLPRLARRYATEGTRSLGGLEASFASFFALAIPAGVGVMVFAEPILTLIFGDRFAEAAAVLRVLMICFLVECLDGLLGVILKAAGRQDLDLRVYSANPVVNVLANFLTIPAWGGVGAGISKLVATLCSSSLRIFVVARAVAPMGWFRLAAKPAAIAAVAAACAVPLLGTVHGVVLAAGYTLACAALLAATRAFSFEALKAALGSPTK
jgi:O-antigen/teichoic acid export membrane protein